MIARSHAEGASLQRWDVLNEFLAFTEERRYLEIGVQSGHLARRVEAFMKTGVDPEPKRGAEGKYDRFYRGPSDDFFVLLDADTRFDVVLVDGLHHADQVLRDVENALRHIPDDGVIVLHDCNPQTELAQRVPRVTGVWNGDCWKAMVALRQRTDLDAFTIDADHGIGVVRKRPNPNPLQDVPERLDYPALVADRRRLLGLVSPLEWCERVGAPLALGRVAVVSAIFGGRDEPIEAPAGDGVDFVMFTDGRGAPGWTLRRSDPKDDPRLAARRVKTLALEETEADIVLWVDGRIRVENVPLRPLLRRALRDHDVAGFPHPWRRTVDAEAAECAKLGLAPPTAIVEQLAAYNLEGFPDSGGLWNTMVLARRNTPTMRHLGRAWWDEISRHTVRDQVSLPFVLWKLGVQCGRLGDDVYRAGSSRYFHRGRHKAAA